MNVYLLLVLVVILLAILFVVYSRTTTGSGPNDWRDCMRQMNEYHPESIEDGKPFTSFDVDRALANMHAVYKSDKYEYFTKSIARNKNDGFFKFVEQIIKSGPIDFGADDYIYDPTKPLTMKYTGLSSKYNGGKNSISIPLSHHGKIKLFVADLQALLYLLPPDALSAPGAERKYRVVYIGAAPSVQNYVTFDLFKNVNFYLYDTQPIDSRVSKLPNVNVYNVYFTQETISEYKAIGVKIDVFISDIRRTIGHSNLHDEVAVYSDMSLQQEIILNLKPTYGSMVKFRPPYYLTKDQVFNADGVTLKPSQDPQKNLDKYDFDEIKLSDISITSDGHVKINGPNPIPLPPDYTYLGGTIYYQSFPHVRSTECRLLSTAEDIKRGPVHFDYQHYEIACLEHNVKRCWATYSQKDYNFSEPYLTPVSVRNNIMDQVNLIPGYDRCLDCTYLLFVVNQLQSRLGNTSTIELLNRIIAQNDWKLCCMVENDKISFHGFYSSLTQPERYTKFLEMYENMISFGEHPTLSSTSAEAHEQATTASTAATEKFIPPHRRQVAEVQDRKQTTAPVTGKYVPPHLRGNQTQATEKSVLPNKRFDK